MSYKGKKKVEIKIMSECFPSVREASWTFNDAARKDHNS
jgi:hypothetical protein